MLLTLENFKKKIEYSLCQQFSNEEEVKSFCNRALKTGAGVICVNPVNVRLAKEMIKGHEIHLSANIGFPFGSHHPEVKTLETSIAIEEGADQIDMVINVGALRSGKDDIVFKDIRAVVESAKGFPVKTIIETWVLTDEEKKRACQIAEQAGAHLVKTTTGVRTQYLEMLNPYPRGAELEDISLMRKVLGPEMKIKASGGIYDLEYGLELIKRGADQLGVSRGEELVEEFKTKYGESVEI